MSTKSEQMAKVRSRDTEPELLLRGLLAARDVRYRIHRSDLPGRPDVYVPRLRLAIFVNGCFWHGHNCRRGQRPTSNSAFWDAKLERNVQRDLATYQKLRSHGIESRVVWTCDRAHFCSVADEIAQRYRAAPPIRCRAVVANHQTTAQMSITAP